jgi:hypothetical protein
MTEEAAPAVTLVFGTPAILTVFGVFLSPSMHLPR